MSWAYPVGAYEGKLYRFAESTYGTGPTTEDMWELRTVEQCDISDDRGNFHIRGLGSRDLQAIRKGLQKPVLKMNLIVKPDLEDFIDDLVTNGDWKSWSIENLFQRSTSYLSLRTVGCCPNSLQMRCEKEDLVKAIIELWGQKSTSATAKWSSGDYAGYGSGDPMGWYDTYVKKGGVETEECIAWEFTVAENLKRTPVIRDTDGDILKYMERGPRAVRGKLTYVFLDLDEFDDMIASTEFALEFGFSTTKKATLSGCKFDEITFPERQEGIPLDLPFTAKSIAFASQ